MKRDPLYLIFKKHLDKIDPETSSLEELIYEVVGEFMALLMKKGNIPQAFLDHVESDLREEVIEMYRKTTYGHNTLREYKNAQKAKSGRKKNHVA